MKIITITLNPAFDVHCYIKNFSPYHENLAEVLSRDVGGKGVNISRALTKNQIENTAVIALGKENSEAFLAGVRQEGLNTSCVLTEGRIRENITIHTENADETRVSFSGFVASEELLFSVEATVERLLEKESVVTFTGSIPPGIELHDVKKFLARLTEKGARLVIDSRSFEKNDLIEMCPWLIKPNREEISHYFEKDITSMKDAAEAASELQRRGIRNVMISLGKVGAVLAGEEGTFLGYAPFVEAISTIGAGDSSIAGFLAATAENLPQELCLKTAIAYGSAACLQDGTKPPQADDIKKLLDQICIVQV